MDHYSGESDYFKESQKRETVGSYSQSIWYTNFIANANAALLDNLEQKVAGGQLTGYRMTQGFPCGHVSEWPSGRYHKAHYHGPGAILVGLGGQGYVLLWPATLGAHPYQHGHGDQVLKINWGTRSIYSPPDAWFHQHFNADKVPARHLAIYSSTESTTPGYNYYPGEDFSGLVSSREGGTLIDYEEEDPQVRKDFEQFITAKGIPLKMPPVTYRK